MGDYFIPTIELTPVENKVLNKYGRICRAFLQEQKPMLFNDLVLTEKLFPYLYNIQEVAAKRVEIIMEELLKKDPPPNKKINAMAWVKHMNMLKATAEEIILRELLYEEAMI